MSTESATAVPLVHWSFDIEDSMEPPHESTIFDFIGDSPHDRYWTYRVPIDESFTDFSKVPGNQEATQVEDLEGSIERVKSRSKIQKIPVQFHAPTQHFSVLQRWEGSVLEVKSKSFIARLADSDIPDRYEEAELPINEVFKDDHEQLVVGAIFYWTIGYLDQLSGRQRVSEIRFRRLPVWSKSDLRKDNGNVALLRDLVEQE